MVHTPDYTLQQRAQFLFWFAECQSDYNQFASKVRRLEGSGAVVPDKRSVLKWKQDFLETGSVEAKKKIKRSR